MFKDILNREYYCDLCHEKFTDTREEKCTGWGMFHEECKVEGITKAKREYEEAELEYQRQVKIQIRKDNKLVRKLRKRLPPKIMEWVDYEISNHAHWEGNYKIVTQEQCRGHRLLGRDYFGDDKCPIRTVYDDISGDYWGDSYAGNVYIYIGNGQYFSLFVNG